MESPIATTECDESPKAKEIDRSEDTNNADTSLHGFNVSPNTTCIENKSESSPEGGGQQSQQPGSCEGSDSGVEVAQCPNFPDYEPPSCDSSIISCCSNYEEAYTLLARRNSTLLDDYNRRNHVSDGATSEGGSESSSITEKMILSGSRTAIGSSKHSKKKVILADNKVKTTTSCPVSNRRSRAVNHPKATSTPARGKSTDRLPPTGGGSGHKASQKPNRALPPDNLPLLLLNSINPNNNKKIDSNIKKTVSRAASINRTPAATTPSDDGRWPSINSKPAPLLSKNVRLEQKRFLQQTEAKSSALDKYATLPRRRKERESLLIQNETVKKREGSVGRTTGTLITTTPATATATTIFRRQVSHSKEAIQQKTLPPYPRKRPSPAQSKTRIYHEFGSQTALTSQDIERAFNGLVVTPHRPQDTEKCDREVQASDKRLEEMEKIKEKCARLEEAREELRAELEEQRKLRVEAEERLSCEIGEKDGLKDELRRHSERVLAILANDNSFSKTEEDADISSDSLMVLEDRFQSVSQVVIKQEEEISKLNECCRSLQRDLEKSLVGQRALLHQQQDLETESRELQEFMQAEKATLSETMKDLEQENRRCKLVVEEAEKELEMKHDECRQLNRICEQRRHENLSLQAKLGVLEGKCRELLVHQGSTVSGAAVALSALISRLDGLVEELVTSYSISDQELDDVIFHNEAYSHSSSSTDATPEKSKQALADKNPSPKGRGSSFVSAVINAIKNAAAQSPFAGNRDLSKDNLCTDNSDSVEMLDSETEPCLMMEHVLEDVVIPDGHTHNMISSSHKLTRSESLNNLTQSLHCARQMETLQPTSFSASFTAGCEISPPPSEFGDGGNGGSISVVDQVIEVDNLVTRLLKVIRIIQMDNEDCMVELQEERDGLAKQVEQQKDTGKLVAKQLKDWEILGARLKAEVKELMHRLAKKNDEIDDLRCDLNQQRHEVEKLSQDVCELSTALSKAELELRVKDEEVTAILKKWEETGDHPDKEGVVKLFLSRLEMPQLKETIVQKEKQLNEMSQEYSASKQVLSERWKEAVNEAKKLYEAIDHALETLHGIQSVVQQCPSLAKLQRDLEETNFRSASGVPLVAPPPDCNANAALLQAIASLGVTSTINTTA